MTSSAGTQLAGLPMRMAVAIVSGFATGWPSTIGAAPAAWKPHILGRILHRFGEVILREASPVGGDVAGVADGNREDVGRLAEHVDDLEGAGLLALDAVGVDRVDDGDRQVLGQFARQVERLVEVAADLQHLRAVDDGLGQFALGDLALGDQDDAVHAGLAGVGRGRGRRIAGRSADDGLGAVGLGLGDRHRHAAVLERTRGIESLELQPDVRAETLRESLGVEQRRVPFLQRDDLVDAVEVEPLRVLDAAARSTRSRQSPVDHAQARADRVD